MHGESLELSPGATQHLGNSRGGVRKGDWENGAMKAKRSILKRDWSAMSNVNKRMSKLRKINRIQ